LDKIFGVSNKYESENDAFEEFLSKKNISYKRQVSSLISRSYSLLDDLKNDYDDL
jgi:uncharacterized membrane-anchored protein YhcB (DUF1043 family)